MTSISSPNKLIPYNHSPVPQNALRYIQASLESGQTGGNGEFTRRCLNELEALFEFSPDQTFLTTSCTASIEMAASLANIEPGDEVIAPSFTFVSSVLPFVNRGARPVFVDIDPTTLCIDPLHIQAALTPSTKAIVPVHYAGVGCDMNALHEAISCAEKNLFVIEDAAQAMFAKRDGKYLGTNGDFGAFSLHGTKNIGVGEGGILVINNPDFIDRAHVLYEKGTDRRRFLEGSVQKYQWVDIGSSYLLSDILAALLLATLEEGQSITQRRTDIWNRYHSGLSCLEKDGLLQLPYVPENCEHNGHIYYIITNTQTERAALLAHLKNAGILGVFHYTPLHSSKAGQKYGRAVGDLPVTDKVSSQLLRLPLFPELSDPQIDYIIEEIQKFYRT